jgi:hypothetical protein
MSQRSSSIKGTETRIRDHLRLVKQNRVDFAEVNFVNSESRNDKRTHSNLDIFKQIINERHVLVKLSKAESYQKIAKKVVTPTLRTGIVTRAFSRSKLELFTRPDPNELTQNLKTRINSIAKKPEVSAKPERRQVANRLLNFNRHFTDNKSFVPLLETERAKMKIVADQSSVNLSQSRRELNLKDFPMERLAIEETQKKIRTNRQSSSSREKSYISLNFCVNKPPPNSSSDFFPQRYKLCARKDHAIVKAFGQSFNSSAKSMLDRNRMSAAFLQQA